MFNFAFNLISNVGEEMVTVLMNKQTLVTSCPAHMSAKKDSLLFASLRHSENKNVNILFLFDKGLWVVKVRLTPNTISTKM